MRIDFFIDEMIENIDFSLIKVATNNIKKK